MSSKSNKRQQLPQTQTNKTNQQKNNTKTTPDPNPVTYALMHSFRSHVTFQQKVAIDVLIGFFWLQGAETTILVNRIKLRE